LISCFLRRRRKPIAQSKKPHQVKIRHANPNGGLVHENAKKPAEITLRAFSYN
jgi:hypothetical protein